MLNPSDSPAIQTKICVGIDNPDTKTYMGDLEGAKRKVYWSNGDKININGLESAALEGIAANSQTATFSFATAPSVPYKVLYPASDWTNATQITLPSTQVWKDGNFADGMVPMSGYSADGANIAVKYLCAVIKVPILQAATDADTDALACVRFRGRNNEQVKGLFGINYTTGVLSGASDDVADREVRVYQEVATSTTDAAVFYITVPAGTYSNGFDIIVQDAHNDCMTKSKTGSVTLEAGNIYNLAEFAFVPDGTVPEADLVINSAEELIAFATAYNNKTYVDISGSMVVKVTSDLSFNAATSADFNATGGIGLKNGVNGSTEDYYFQPFFDGGGHTISGLEATVPLFVATQSSGTIKDLTIDDSCTFTFTHPDTGECNMGPVVGYHRGKLENVTVNADVTVVAKEVSQVTNIGGIVARVVKGSIEDCVYTGTITVPAGFKAAAKVITVGGLAGTITNAEGIIKDSNFAGMINNEGQMVASSEDDEFKGNPQLMIGGIIGQNYGTIDNCTVANHATGITVTLNDGSDHDYTGTVVTHSTNAYHYAIAGIAGRNDGTVKDCTNNATVLNIFSAERGTGGNMNGRYLEAAGIVGFNASGKTVSGCTNNGAIITRANPKVQYVGGVVAWNYGTVSSCVNASTATIGMGTSHTSPYGARMSYIGGVIGHNRSSATVSNIQNNAAINISRVESATGVVHRIGGVIGQSDAVIDGTSGGGSIANSGAVSQSNGVGMCSTPTPENDYGYFLGGIVGYATKAVKNVSNSGAVTYTCTAKGIGAQYVHVGGVIGKLIAASTVDVEKCTNVANVTYVASAKYSENNATRYYYNYIGGIVGYASNAAVKGDITTHCTNSGIIKGGDGSANSNQPSLSFVVGGIIGYITGESSIEYCELSGAGQAYNDHWSNRGISSYDCPMDGGIAGYVIGAEGKPITISNCNVSSTSGTDGNTAVYARRGAVGGIVGMAKYATVSGCSTSVSYSGSGYFYGGIIAAAQNSTISSCTYSGSTIQSSQLQIGGGIIGQLDTGSTVDGCSSYATTVNKNGTAVTTTGGIAGKSVAGSTIQNCHYTATIGKICGDDNFTDGDGNAGDL